MNAVPHSSWYLTALATGALAVVIVNLYGLWQAVLGRASIWAATSVAVFASVITFYVVYLGLSFLTRRVEPFWLGLLTSVICYSLIFWRHVRPQHLAHARVVGGAVLGLASVVILGVSWAVVGTYIGCQFSRCVLP